MRIKQYDIWLADFNSGRGTEPGKMRPVVVVQTDLLNETHLSTLICPVTTSVKKEIKLLRLYLRKSQLDQLSDILVDQVRTIDNRRLVKKLGQLTKQQKFIVTPIDALMLEGGATLKLEQSAYFTILGDTGKFNGMTLIGKIYNEGTLTFEATDDSTNSLLYHIVGNGTLIDSSNATAFNIR